MDEGEDKLSLDYFVTGELARDSFFMTNSQKSNKCMPYKEETIMPDIVSTSVDAFDAAA